MIPLLSHPHFGCDSCMDMFQTEIFQFAGRSFTRLLMRIPKKSGGSQLSQSFSICAIQLWNIILKLWNRDIMYCDTLTVVKRSSQKL
jgi:hypothetical protein